MGQRDRIEFCTGGSRCVPDAGRQEPEAASRGGGTIVITVFSQKGEQAKSTTAINLVACAGRRAQLIDLDVQQGDSLRYAGKVPDVDFSDALPDRFDPEVLTVIDTPPTVNEITVQALQASTLVLMPCTPYQFSLEALSRTFQTVAEVREHAPELVGRVLFTRCDRSQFTQGILVAATALSEWPRLQATVPDRRAEFERAVNVGLPLALHRPKSAGALAYAAVTRELLAS